MDQSEQWANDYLVYRGFNPTDIVFEPDGNVPPDFLVHGCIAVEVRRLNQHWESPSGDRVPLEALAMPLLVRLRKLLDSFGPPTGNVSWYVFHRFERPQLTTDWEPLLRKKLQPFQDAEIADDESILVIDDHFSLRLRRRAEPGTKTFIWGGDSDFDRGGWVIEELEKNITICITEKSRKIAAHREKYPEWWLILVDHIMGGTRETVNVKHDWDKVLIIHPSNFKWAYEIPGSKPA